jgi:hypothetical protein
MIGDDLAGAVRADSLALLDEQVANLSERVFELRRAADRQLFLWLTFAAEQSPEIHDVTRLVMHRT